MTQHVKHVCPGRVIGVTSDGKEVRDKVDGRVWGKNLNWKDEAIPLLKPIYRNGVQHGGHVTCPYCGKPTAEMESCTGQEIALLNSGGLGRKNMRVNEQNQDMGLVSEIAELREMITKLMEGKK